MAKRDKAVETTGKILVAVKTPADSHYVSRGFYQVEENSLYVPIEPSGTFYSFLDSSQMSIDADNAGRPLFIQLHTPRTGWKIVPSLSVPPPAATADIRFVSFRDRIGPARIETSPDHDLARIIFSDETGSLYAIADNLLFEVSPDSHLVSIWIAAIMEDRAAAIMAAWRKKAREEISRTASAPGRYPRIQID